MRTVHLLTTALAAASLLACQGNGGQRFLSVGTGGTGGVYYPLGGAIASRLSVRDSLRQYTAEVTGGSVENVNRILAGQIDMGFSLSVTAYEAFHGGEGFGTPAENLRIVAPLYSNLTHVLVPASSPVRDLSELRGMRVSVGSAGSGTEQISRQLLEVHGLTYDDVEPQYLSFSESTAALRDGAVGAAIFSVGVPAAAVLEATTSGNVRMIGVTPERTAELRERYPYYSAGMIPAGSYPGVDEALPTVGMMNWMVADEALDDDVVELLLNILDEDRVSLGQVHDMAKQIDLRQLDEAPIPLHPAAEEFVSRR
ncbi:MAG: TAXI family TRAP transporter solute-binding subunit [Gemmatimonadota bacterium]|nr:TAXI family TRAP transporter solute-binding subunit [Gemmatimonadota bacterium]